MLEELEELDRVSEVEDVAGDDVPEAPIPLMFGREKAPAALVEDDPALDAAFWSDDEPQAGDAEGYNAADETGDAEGDEEGDEEADEEADEEGAYAGDDGAMTAGRARGESAYPRRSALLPKVEIFQDGEHAEAVREADDLAERSRRFDPAAVVPAAELVKAAGKPAGQAARPPVEVSAPPARAPRVAPRKPIVQYSLPTEGILTAYPDGQYWIIDDKTRHEAEVLRETLKEFGIEAEVTGIKKGPVITMFEILPAPGVRLSKIAGLCDNIALRLAASSVRIVAPIPGKHAVGIEVPNARRSIVSFKEIVESEAFKNAKMEVPVVLGKDITGDVQVVELTQTPHLLIAGATGSGKSVCVNSIILSILYRRSFNEVKLILIDPKIVELKLYNGIPHLLTPVITEPKRAFQALQYCICEMERRYSLLDAMGVRDIKSYNRKIAEKSMATDRLPYIVVIIDEFADLMATTGKELESTLARLAAMSRAVGIHLVLATQRPSIDVITGLIKANIPSRIAFMVAGKFDSRIIIDMVGAEKLLGRGDMLYSSATDAFPVRMQGAFVSEDEVERVVAYVKTLGEPDYIDEEIFVDDEDDDGPSLFDEEDDDPLYEKALEIVLSQGKASASFLQRKLKIGYNRAARLVELMEEKGIVGKSQGSKPRDLMHNPEMGRAPNPRARYVPDFSPDDGEADVAEGDEDGDEDGEAR
ncbi:MAG: DNA translocase FtsK [Spirochaetes bacterium]|nr:DNA translocase FtsK [Spirochaetota bacterium]MBU1080365.1 DNA translocase FtsK [Spirochaetota bacterium]